MKHKYAYSTLLCLMSVAVTVLLLCPVSYAQRYKLELNDPHIGYIYPAGMQRGTKTTITVGGQHLERTDSVYVTGRGVEAEVTSFDRPINQREAIQMREKLKETRKEMGMEEGNRPRGRDMQHLLEKSGITRDEAMKIREFSEMRRNPKVQENAAVAEEVVVEITISPDAELGRREVRVIRDGRISNPLAFYVGDYPESTEDEKSTPAKTLPVVFNGQIMPGETDSWIFKAGKGDQLVVASYARELIPHLADAVPGWFQAVIALYDSDGKELAYADDYRFNPDPVLYYKIPSDGMYKLEIKDSLYRGRQDFVYRITLGEIPFVTSNFPLGAKNGEKTDVRLAGINLPKNKITVKDSSRIDRVGGVQLIYPIPFAHSYLAEFTEREPNNTPSDPMRIQSSCVVNGRIGESGDRDVFEIKLRKGGEIIAEVMARRLNSQLDSVLVITDETGKQLAFNNDYEDRSLGRMTHHADSRIAFTAPQNGTYYIHLGDIQSGGGDEYGYRLKLAPSNPDFALRTAPSKLNAVPGAAVPLTVYALRKDGFTGEIRVEVNDILEGLRLDGARIPADHDKVELTVTLPEDYIYVPAELKFTGHAVINGKPVVRRAVPAEDMMQAFIYHHLVPTEELLVANIENRRTRMQAKCIEKGRVQLTPGKNAKLSFESLTWFGSAEAEYQVEPRSVPDGVTVEKVVAENNIIEITVHCADSVRKGLEGNLLFNQFIERQRRGENQDGAKDKIRIPFGVLPAVQFVVK